MIVELKAPFPYFGGKSTIAHLVWDALGNPKHYIEPFFGSGAVLLSRPNYDQAAAVETVNDKDGFVANVWRSIKFSPAETAKWCDWPVNHADLRARRNALLKNEARLLDNLIADDMWHDPKMAGYWIWAAGAWIGEGLTRPESIPRIGNGGSGIHVIGRRPAVSHAGQGVHALGLRVAGKIPHISHDVGVHAIGKRPHVDKQGCGVHKLSTRTGGVYEWMDSLSARMRHVRIVCGDWSQVCGGDWQDNMGAAGIFFDPPYGDKAGRCKRLYRHESGTVADEVRAWCLARGARPSYRIVLAGYFEEHEGLMEHGWRVARWSAYGGLGNLGAGRGRSNRHKETLFLSPHCIDRQGGLF